MGPLPNWPFHGLYIGVILTTYYKPWEPILQVGPLDPPQMQGITARTAWFLELSLAKKKHWEGAQTSNPEVGLQEAHHVDASEIRKKTGYVYIYYIYLRYIYIYIYVHIYTLHYTYIYILENIPCFIGFLF